MSTQITYSREYLLSLPEKMRRDRSIEAMNKIVQNTMNQVLKSAANGKTQYMLDANRIRSVDDPSDEDLADFLCKKFPGCRVSLEEQWVEVSRAPALPPTRELKTAIVIDWS